MFINKLKIQNFGPIKNGYTEDDGYIPFNTLCVFCGTQGTGKSTVVKLYSTLVWLEKALMRGDFKATYIEQYNRFVKNNLAYQGIDSYVKDDTFLHFIGQCYDFIYEKGKFRVEEHREELSYNRPQVMYVPAERNFLASTDKSSSVKGLPETLGTLQEVFRQACQYVADGIELPINGVQFKYDTLNNIARIEASDYKVRLSKASSGLQSATPLFVTMHYLYQTVINEVIPKSDKLSDKEKKIRDKRIEEILLDNTIDNELRSALIKKLSDNVNKRLINIIEEPEQNLFPDSQERVLHQMIELSATGDNQLLFTTHSPYMLNHLMVAIKAKQVEELLQNSADTDELNSEVPALSRIDGNKVNVFQLDLDGSIHRLETKENIPSDNNYLNIRMMDVNSKYSHLIEIQCRYE